jgi:drug/metabolite transporter (DMT)-like permease
MGGVTALAVILLGERVNTLSAVALPLAVVGVLLTSLVTPEEEAVEEVARGPVTPGADAADAATAAPSAGVRGGAVKVGAARASSGGPAAGTKSRLRTTAGAGWGLLAAVLFGLTFLVYGYADGIPAVSAAAWGRLTGMAVFLPFALLRVPLRMQPRLYVTTTVAAALDSVAYTAIAAALVIGPVSVASVLSAQFATIALLLGVIVRHERLAAHQIAGLACTIAAVTLFALAA